MIASTVPTGSSRRDPLPRKGSRSTCTVPARISAPIGTLMKKIHRQSPPSTISPPTVGPSTAAAPPAEVKIPIA
ncbi:hypothetical protein EV193_101918 [Herbihabitans rhizosphaerae]|uniref:Uncharacterized protein n=1 Tax=Herbihabitans rhizosphaerae TaxID=1872711 RepID=A0A4Q7L6T2_9PSEU|nr:hypothetical protein EV193_101918 [Herbihabitans rhizosphaerae]